MSHRVKKKKEEIEALRNATFDFVVPSWLPYAHQLREEQIKKLEAELTVLRSNWAAECREYRKNRPDWKEYNARLHRNWYNSTPERKARADTFTKIAYEKRLAKETVEESAKRVERQREYRNRPEIKARRAANARLRYTTKKAAREEKLKPLTDGIYKNLAILDKNLIILKEPGINLNCQQKKIIRAAYHERQKELLRELRDIRKNIPL